MGDELMQQLVTHLLDLVGIVRHLGRVAQDLLETRCGHGVVALADGESRGQSLL